MGVILAEEIANKNIFRNWLDIKIFVEMKLIMFVEII